MNKNMNSPEGAAVSSPGWSPPRAEPGEMSKNPRPMDGMDYMDKMDPMDGPAYLSGASG